MKKNRWKAAVVEYLAWFAVHMLVVMMLLDFFLRSGY